MTDAPRDRPNVFRRLSQPAALNYLILTGAGFLIYGFMMMSAGNDVGAIIALILAIPGVLARWTSAPVLILLLTTFLQIDPGFSNLVGRFSGLPWFQPRSSQEFSLDLVLLAAGLLAYTIGHYRLSALVHQSMPVDPTTRREVDTYDPPRRPVGLVLPNELPRLLALGAACVVLGQVAWFAIVLIDRLGRPNAPSFTPGASRFMLVVWILGTALMVISALLVYLRAARMTRLEAALSLRDDYFQENRRETDRLQRWRKWFKERVASRRQRQKH